MDESMQAVHVTCKGTELTVDLVLKALKLAVDVIREKKAQPEKLAHGEQSYDELSKHGDVLVSTSVMSDDMKQLRKQLKKSGVDFHPMENTATGEYHLYFKANDYSLMQDVFEDILKTRMEAKDNPFAEKINNAQKKASTHNKSKTHQNKTEHSR